MAKSKPRKFRVAKIEVIKAIARRPKGLFRPDKVHRDETAYWRSRAKSDFRRRLKEEA